MAKNWLATFFIAILGTLTICFIYTFAIIVFPLTLSFFFLIFFGIFALRATIGANATPGLEKLEEPDFWFSPIYFSWLYVNDRKRWATYVAILSFLAGIFLGSMFGYLIAISLKFESTVSLISWLIGMFWMGLMTLEMARSTRWEKPTTIDRQNQELS